MKDSVILQSTARWLLPLLLVFALLLLLRGHHEPGGGFVAGLTAAGAFALYRMAYGGAGFGRILRFEPTSVVALGLALALAGALAGWLGGGAFLVAGWVQLGEGFGELKLGTPLIFDVGVALVVLGFALLALESLEDAHD